MFIYNFLLRKGTKYTLRMYITYKIILQLQLFSRDHSFMYSQGSENIYQTWGQKITLMKRNPSKSTRIRQKDKAERVTLAWGWGR